MGLAQSTARHKQLLAFALVSIGVVGIAVRLWLWWTSAGSSDVDRWMLFGWLVHENGLSSTYVSEERFNHPPLMGLYVAEIWDLTDRDESDFARLLKVPALVGEVIVIFVLARLAGLPAFAAYATAPAAVLVSSYHGNTDSFYVAFVLLAALAFDRERFFSAGLLFGAALNVKLLPLVLLPLLLITAPNRRAFLRVFAGLAIAAIPYLPWVVSSGRSMYRNMLAYNSVPSDWGFLAFLNPAVEQPELADEVAPLRDAFIDNGRYLILAAILTLALASRYRLRLPMVEQLALGGALFLLLTPGFGVQYVVLIAPLMFLVSLRWALAWVWLAGAFIAVRYAISPITGRPLESELNQGVLHFAALIGVLCWALLAVFVWQRLSARRPDGSPGGDQVLETA